MSNLREDVVGAVFAGIIDAVEYLEYNSESEQRIADYAFNGMDICLGDDEKAEILKKLNEYKRGLDSFI